VVVSRIIALHVWLSSSLSLQIPTRLVLGGDPAVVESPSRWSEAIPGNLPRGVDPKMTDQKGRHMSYEPGYFP